MPTPPLRRILIVTMALIAVCGYGVGYVYHTDTHAASIEQLRERISNRETKIARLEKEIEKYKDNIQKVAKKRQSLEEAVQELRATEKKLEAELAVTQNKIESTNLTIDQIQQQIEQKREKIGINLATIEETVQRIHHADQTSFVEALLKYENISELWDTVATIQNIHEKLQTDLSALRSLKKQLEEKKNQRINEKANLVNLREELGDKEEVVAYHRQQKREVLGQTQNKEERYRQLLEEKKRQRRVFKQQLQQLESQLQIQIDTSKFPEEGTKVFSAPLNDVSLKSCWNGGSAHANCVTQYFGRTSFSQRTAAYKGNGHNGVDFRASVGEPLRAPAAGTVRAIGNTDRIRGCYSYGKWILLEHPNGLSTLYAHLSLIKVSTGQTVSRGQVIGYTGNTGYSTGPHLHFTTYATEGVRVVKYRNSNNCKQATIPIADTDAYLNPLSYL